MEWVNNVHVQKKSNTHTDISNHRAEGYRLKKRVFRADLEVVIVAAFLMCGGSEFQTTGPKS